MNPFQPPQIGVQPGISRPVTNIIQPMPGYQPHPIQPQPFPQPVPQQPMQEQPIQTQPAYEVGGLSERPANPLLENAMSQKLMPQVPVQETLPEPEKKGYDREMDDYERRLDETEASLWQWEPEKAIKTGLPIFDAAFDGGLESGLYLLAAPANMGKTAFMLDIADRVVKNNEDVLCLIGSLDDSMKKVIPRYISVNQRIQIKEAKNPRKYEDDPVIMEKRKKGIRFLKENRHKLMFFDANDSNEIEDWEARIQQMRMTVPEGTRILVFFDSFADLTSRDFKGTRDDMEIHISQKVKEWTTVYDLIIIGTMHLRKTNGKHRPTREDLKGTNRLDYDADLVWLLYNEVKVEKENANVYWNEDGNAYKQPVIELNFAKNKISDFDRTIFYHFSPSRNLLLEASEERQDGYLTQVYS